MQQYADDDNTDLAHAVCLTLEHKLHNVLDDL